MSLSGAHLTTVPNAGDAPLLLLHGTADSVVPYAWAQSTVTAATNVGVARRAHHLDRRGALPSARHRTEILEQTPRLPYVHMDRRTQLFDR